MSVQGHEWTHLYREHIWMGTGGTYTSSFFAITGFHGLHVTIGVLFLAITTLMAAAGNFTPHRHDFLTCVSLYWHFVDVVWISSSRSCTSAALHLTRCPARRALRRSCRRRRGHAPVNRTLQWVVWAALGLLIAGIVHRVRAPAVESMEHRADVPLDRFNHGARFHPDRTHRPAVFLRRAAGQNLAGGFFFTACPGPCLVMNAKMEAIGQALTRDHADVRQVSFSINPPQDTPEVLRRYAERFHAPADRWFFLTGDQGAIYELARKAFLLPTVDQTNKPNRQPDEGEFIHSEKIALVDREGFVRAYFDSTNPEVVQQVLTSVGTLLREQPDAAARTSKAVETVKTGT